MEKTKIQLKAGIDNIELVVIKTKAGITKIAFPVVENLRNKAIIGIETWKVGTVPKSPLGNATINDTAFNKGFLTLNIDGKEKIKDFPLQALVIANNNGVMKRFNQLKINDQKSYVSFSDSTGIVTDEVVLLAFYFED